MFQKPSACFRAFSIFSAFLIFFSSLLQSPYGRQSAFSQGGEGSGGTEAFQNRAGRNGSCANPSARGLMSGSAPAGRTSPVSHGIRGRHAIHPEPPVFRATFGAQADQNAERALSASPCPMVRSVRTQMPLIRRRICRRLRWLNQPFNVGEVWKARDTRLDRTVAVRVLPKYIADRDDVRARFEREARAVSSLNHPNICVLYDIGKQDGIDFKPLPARIRSMAITFSVRDRATRVNRNGLGTSLGKSREQAVRVTGFAVGLLETPTWEAAGWREGNKNLLLPMVEEYFAAGVHGALRYGHPIGLQKRKHPGIEDKEIAARQALRQRRRMPFENPYAMAGIRPSHQQTQKRDASGSFLDARGRGVVQHQEFSADNDSDIAGTSFRDRGRQAGGEFGSFGRGWQFRKHQHPAVWPDHNGTPGTALLRRRLPRFCKNILRSLAKIDIRHSWRERIDGPRLVVGRTRMTLAKPIDIIGKVGQTGKAESQLLAGYELHDLHGLRRRLCL
jgi:hypothetical protein